MGDEEINAVSEVIKSGWTGLGPKTQKFEHEFADYCGVDNAVAVNSGTAALDLAMRLLEIGPGDEVIVPAITFVSTAHVVVYNGAKPVFADVDYDTMNIDCDDLKRKITSKTKAIIVVHYAGRPVNMDSVIDAANGISVVEDCAHAAGAMYNGSHVGSIGAIGCFSFHSVKNLSCGDGGMLTTYSDKFAERARRLRWLGIDKSTWDRSDLEKSYWWEYAVDEIGLKCHMNDINASIGLEQLRKLNSMNDRRLDIATQYESLFSNFSHIRTPPQSFESSWHLYCIKAEDRDRLSAYLMENGISTGVHYKPIHLYECYGYQSSLPVAEKLCREILTLPLFPDLDNDQVEYIVDSVKKFYQ
jgi:perosamine synthetase